jgi:hypothetical protein
MDSRAELAESLEGYAARGSRNGKFIGSGRFEPWRGVEAKGAGTGSRIMAMIGDRWGGLKDIGATIASGSVYQHIAKTLLFQGAGQVHIEGANIPNAIASSILQLMLFSGGSYTGVPYTAGLTAPSAPDVGVLAAPGAGYSGYTDGAIDIVLERRRPETGAKSVASLPSVVINPQKKTFYIKFPAAQTGQTEWAVFSTEHGLGGNGKRKRLGYQYSVFDIPESLVAASSVNGIARALEFDFRNGDLLPEEASIRDYPPSAGTHVVQLENATVVLGAFADSTTSASSTNPGTVGLVSLDNHPESYNPNHRIYFPEQIVAVLSRMTDSYAYVACRNSIWAIQYVGDRGDFLPSVTISNVLPEVGIINPHNWCQAFGRLFMWLEGAGLVGMTPDGEIDYNLFDGCSEFTKHWDQDTVLSFDPRTRSVVAMWHDESISYCLQNNRLGYPTYLKDAGNSGTYLSAITARGELVVSIAEGGNVNAYTFDKGAAAMPVVHVTQWFAPGDISRTNSLSEIGLTMENGNSDEPLIVGIHKNLHQPVWENLQTLGADTLQINVGETGTEDVGKRICVFAPNIADGKNYVTGKVKAVAGNVVTISKKNGDALLLNPTARAFAIIGDDVFVINQKPNRKQHLPPIEPDIFDAKSLAISVYHPTDAENGQLLTLEAYGDYTGGSWSK